MDARHVDAAAKGCEHALQRAEEADKNSVLPFWSILVRAFGVREASEAHRMEAMRAREVLTVNRAKVVKLERDLDKARNTLTRASKPWLGFAMRRRVHTKICRDILQVQRQIALPLRVQAGYKSPTHKLRVSPGSSPPHSIEKRISRRWTSTGKRRSHFWTVWRTLHDCSRKLRPALTPPRKSCRGKLLEKFWNACSRWLLVIRTRQIPHRGNLHSMDRTERNLL